MLINAPDEEALCLTCHGSDGKGATTNVEDGVQYASAATQSTPHGAVAGALRGGGFVNARIDSTNPVRVALPRWDSGNAKYVASFSSKVPEATDGTAATSAHLKLAGADAVDVQGTAWGNGGLNAGVGPAVTLGCASCHNPHGNGQYRILNPVPKPATGSVVVDATTGVQVPEMRTFNTVTGARNYTVRPGGSLATVSATSGDYWRRYQPYDIVPKIRSDFNPAAAASNGTTCASNPANNGSTVNCPVGYPAGYFRGDAPEFVAGQANTGATWRSQMTAWCATCHSRYMTTGTYASAGGASYSNSSGDAIFKYRHPTSVECTQCHVAHGSNAKMPGSAALGTNFSGNFAYPVVAGGTVASNGSSRLLKVDNRGTCQQCHDPTGTVPVPTATYP